MTGIDIEEARRLVQSVPHWHHRFEIVPGLVTPGSYDPDFLLQKLDLPRDLGGVRVMDVGCSDGFFTSRLHARGAEIVSLDYRAKTGHGFAVTEALSGGNFDYRRMNVYEIGPELGNFDIVLFLGVLYHLPDMLRALVALRRVCRGTLFVETHCENDFAPHVAAARYYRASTLAEDFTNFWAPNRLCVLDMLHDAAFDAVRDEAWGSRLLVRAEVAREAGRERKIAMAYGVV